MLVVGADVALLSSCPHLVHPGFDIIIWLGALRATNVGVLVVHLLAHIRGFIRRIGIDVGVALRGTRHRVRR